MSFRHNWISILGLYKYDDTIFDNFHIPEELDKDALIDELLLQLAELEVIYANPEIMKRSIGSWSKTRLPVWQHLYDTTVYQYEPLNTYNMENISKKVGDTTYSSKDDYISNTTTETGEQKHNEIVYDEKQKGDETGNEKELTKGNDAYSEVEQNNNYVYGFNSADKVLRNSEENSTKSSDEWNTDRGLNDGRDWNKSENSTTTGNETISKDQTKWDKSGRLKEDVESSVVDTGSRADGNTGIYARQDLIQKERDIAIFDIYAEIIRDFKKRYCIQVW